MRSSVGDADVCQSSKHVDVHHALQQGFLFQSLSRCGAMSLLLLCVVSMALMTDNAVAQTHSSASARGSTNGGSVSVSSSSGRASGSFDKRDGERSLRRTGKNAECSERGRGDKV